MSDTPRRHPNVVNLSEIEPDERLKGSRIGAKFKPVGARAGASGLGCTWYEVAPGRAAMPRHFHCANEEALFVLEGTGTLRLGDATVEVKPGDWISFPVGPAHAHQLRNTGQEPLRYLGISTRHNVDVVGYPDSKKVMAAAVKPGAAWTDPAWVKLVFEEDKAVDYFHGEKVD